MGIGDIKAGERSPEVFNMVVEIPMHESHVKYEFNKDLGVLCVDRFLQVPMYYPCNYGYITGTKGGDGDPLDVLLISNFPIFPGVLIQCRPVGVLFMVDESGNDEKIIALPTKSIDPLSKNIKDICDINNSIKKQIEHFFECYKKLDDAKWVKIGTWGDANDAKSLIVQSLVQDEV